MIGAFTGFANGIFGSGGGAVVVCAMERFMYFKPHKAHATAVAVILPLSVVSAIFYLKGTKPEIIPIVCVCGGGMAGGLTGSKLMSRLKPFWLSRIFGCFMTAAALMMIFK